MDIKIGSRIHNRFDIEVRDKDTGELKQKGQAENIILDRMYSRLCNFNSYFNYIHFGQGTGILDPSRELLFDELGYKSAETEETVKDFPISKWTRKIVLNPEEYVGESITEVGISDTYSSTKSKSYINTHALIKDAEGNLLSIEKTDTDVVIIYATVFIELQNKSENIYFTNLPFHNALLNYLLGGSSPSNYIELGRSWNKGLNSTDSLVLSKNSTCTANNIDKKVIYNVRFGIDEGNTYISEIGLRDTFTCKLPNVEVFTQHNVVDKQLGIGDGVKDTFVVPDRRIKNLVIKVDNVIVNNYSHTREISINYNIGYFTDIKFSEISKSGIVASKISTDKSQLAIYSIDGEIAYQMSTLDIEDNGNIRAVCFNSDGEYVALYKNIQPALLMYKRQNDNYIKLPEIIDQPTTLTTNNPNSNYGKPSITFSYNDMYLALGLPFDITIVIYKRNGDEFIRLPTPEDIPKRYNTSGGIAPNYYGADNLTFSSDTKYFACTSVKHPYIYMYQIVDDVFTRISIPDATVSNGNRHVNNIVFSPDNKYFIATYYDEPYLTLYKIEGEEFSIVENHNINLNSYITGIGFTNDGKNLLLFLKESNPSYKLYEIIGDEFIERTDISDFLTSSRSNLSFIQDKLLKTDEGCYNVEKTRSLIKFDTPPPEGAVITANYTVPYIPKTEDYVLDVTCEIQFGEGV